MKELFKNIPINKKAYEVRQVEEQLRSLEWIPLKVILKEWEDNDKRYLDYLDERLRLRNLHEQLKNELSDLKKNVI